MGECAQKRLKWIIILQAAKHGSENQHHRKRRAVLSKVEALKAYFADAINSKSGEYMNNVVGLFEPVNHEFVCLGHWRGINQGVGSDALADQLIGIATSEAAFRQRLQFL